MASVYNLGEQSVAKLYLKQIFAKILLLDTTHAKARCHMLYGQKKNLRGIPQCKIGGNITFMQIRKCGKKRQTVGASEDHRPIFVGPNMRAWA